MKKKCFYPIISIIFSNVFFINLAVSQSDESYSLRIKNFESSKDSLILLVQRRFWQEFREQVEKSENIQIVAGWDDIIELLEYIEETGRTPAIFDSSTKIKPTMKVPNAHLKVNIQYKTTTDVEIEAQITKISTGEEISFEHVDIPLPAYPWHDNTRSYLRKLIWKLLEPMDARIKKQKLWLGEPFNPEKINILVADFINNDGDVDKRGKDWTTKTSNELYMFMQADTTLKEVVEIKRLYSDKTNIVIREENAAKEVGEVINADIVIWGQNLCEGDSICYYTRAYIEHPARHTSIIERGFLSISQILKADLPQLIGAKANTMMKFIIGWTYLNDNQHKNFQQAYNYLRQALLETDQKERRDILMWAAEAARLSSHYNQGIQWYKELENLYIKASNRSGLAYIYNNLGIIYQDTGEWENAIEHYQKSLEKLVTESDNNDIARVFNNLGNIYRFKGEWDKATEYYQRSLETKGKIGDTRGMAQTYGNLGLICQAKAEWDKAIEYFQKSLKIDEKIGDIHSMALTFINLGVVYQAKADWDEAMGYFQKSLKICEKVGNIRGIATIHGNLGIIYYYKGDWDKAIEYYQISLETKERIGDIHGMANTLNNLGLVYEDKGDWDKAIEYYQKVLKIDEEVGDTLGMAITYGNIGIVYHAKGEWGQAIEYYQKSLEGKGRIGDFYNMARTNSDMSKLYFDQKKYTEAVSLLFEVLFVFHKFSATSDISQANGTLNDFKKEIGEKAYKEIIDKTLTHIKENGIRWGRHVVVSKEEVLGIMKNI